MLEITKPFINRESIFYIGLGKTGSASIFYSFPNRPTFHYHNYHYFNYVNGSNLKSNQELFNLISTIGYMLGFKPIVIECTRDKKARAISALFHNHFNDKNLCHKKLLNYNDEELRNLLLEYYNEKPVYKTVTIPNNIIHIILKLEEKNKWGDILTKYGINDYIAVDKNVNEHPLYIELKERCKNINM